MNRINETNWPASSPSADFAAITVERLLQSRVESIVKVSAPHRLVWLLVAALLVSGAALGFALQSRTRQVLPVVKSLPTVSAQTEMHKTNVVLTPAPVVARVPLVTTVPTSNKQRIARKPAIAVPKAATSAAPSAAPKVPACGCERGFGDYICDCF